MLEVGSLSDRRAQQITRIFLTWIFNIYSSKQIVCCERGYSWKRNDQALGLVILSNSEDLDRIMENGTSLSRRCLACG